MQRVTHLIAVTIDVPDKIPTAQTANVLLLCMNHGELDQRLFDKYGGRVASMKSIARIQSDEIEVNK